MNYAYLGQTGVQVSEVCLGTMTFGKEADEAESIRIMDRALDAGVNFFDTANIYVKGASEEIVGRWLTAHRDKIVLATKAYFPTGPGVNEQGSSRRHLTIEVERSLKRLKTDRIDLFYLHHWDEHTAIEESLAALSTLVEQGKILYCGVSNFAAWQTMKAIAVAQSNGFAPVTCIQPQYSLLKRQAEVELLPLAISERLAVCPYSPVAAGILTGKYHRGETGRIHVNPMYEKRFGDPKYMEIAGRFVEYAKARGVSPSALAVAWVIAHPGVTSAIVGARNLAQFDEALGCVEIQLSEEERERISALSIAPPLPTDREPQDIAIGMLKK